MASDPGLIDLFQTQFSTLLKMNLQQETSKLRGRVLEAAHTGAKLVSPIQFVGPTTMVSPAGRFAAKSNSSAIYTRRWISPLDKENDQLIDNFDELKTPIDPKSQLVSRVKAACMRAYDDEIIAAATRSATIGVDNGSLTQEAFNTTLYQIAADFDKSGTASGLSVAKLSEAYRILEHAHALEEDKQITLVIGSKQHDDLRKQAQVVSSDFNKNGGVLDNGTVSRFMGMDVIVSERLPTITDKNSNANSRGCLAFVKTGIYLGVWQDVKVEVLRRNELSSNPWDINTMISFGGTRTELGRVVQIAALDTIGADNA